MAADPTRDADPTRFVVLKPLLREAAEWRLLGLLFERPRETWRRDVSALAPEIFDPGLRAAITGAERTLESDYLDAVGPGAPVNLRSTAHRSASDPGHVLAELTALFEAFAFAPQREEPPDHASVLCGFVGYLRLKEALARAGGQWEGADLVRRIADSVVREHLALMAEPVCDALFEREASVLALAAQSLLERAGRRPTDVAGAFAPVGVGPGEPGDEEELSCG